MYRCNSVIDAISVMSIIISIIITILHLSHSYSYYTVIRQHAIPFGCMGQLWERPSYRWPWPISSGQWQHHFSVDGQQILLTRNFSPLRLSAGWIAGRERRGEKFQTAFALLNGPGEPVIESRLVRCFALYAAPPTGQGGWGAAASRISIA